MTLTHLGGDEQADAGNHLELALADSTLAEEAVQEVDGGAEHLILTPLFLAHLQEQSSRSSGDQETRCTRSWLLRTRRWKR